MNRNDNSQRGSANARFFGCFPGTINRELEDGIVSAANTFDLLPDEDKPSADPLPGDVLEILRDARRRVKGHMLPGTRREDVLNALGFIRRNKRLRDIVEYRAEIIREHFGRDRLTQLENVINLAVKCRNYYTHGPGDQESGDADFTDVETVFFLTRTLEFIYGTSELLYCGWDPAKSVREYRHPIGGFIEYYDAKRSVVLGPE